MLRPLALLTLLSIALCPGIARALPTGLRISVDQIRSLESAGTRVHYVDARAKTDGAGVRGSTRLRKDRVDPPRAWPRDAVIVAYCT